VIDFATPDEDETLQAALDKKLAEARRNAWVDYSFHINIRGNIQKMLPEIPVLAAAGFPSFKVFMAYEGFRVDDHDLLKIMDAAARSGAMVDVHAENGPLADAISAGLCVTTILPRGSSRCPHRDLRSDPSAASCLTSRSGCRLIFICARRPAN